MKCDFCSDRQPIMLYPVKESTPWAACLECVLLIDTGELHALGRRILRSLMPRLPPEIRALMQEELMEWLHSAFWTQRAGRAQPVWQGRE